MAGLVPPGHKVAVRAHRRRRAGAALQPDHRHREAGHRAGPARAHAQPGVLRASRATTRRAPARSRPPTSTTPATFKGIVRADGRIATRNYIGVLTSVNCSATVARAIADHFRRDIHPEALARLSERRRRGRAHARRRLRHRQRRRAAAGAAPHARRLCAAPQLRGRCWSSAWAARRTRSSGLMEQEGLADRRARCTPSTSRTPAAPRKTVAHGIELVEWLLEEANRVQRAAGEREPHHGRPAVRRLGRLLGHQRQPGARRGGRSAGAPRRHARSCRRRPRSTAANTC